MEKDADQMPALGNHYAVIEGLIDHLLKHRSEQPSLSDLAVLASISPSHLQRVFKEYVGVSPKDFLQYATFRHAKRLLNQGQAVLSASLECGLSGPGRLHDLFVKMEAVSPGEFKSMGQGLVFSYGFHETPLGLALLCASERGLSALYFTSEEEKDAALQRLRQYWQAADLRHAPEVTLAYCQQIFDTKVSLQEGKSLPLFIKGTAFQVKVWKALLEVPLGGFTHYEALAEQAELPEATRAVANAVGANPISLLIPCHRVLRKSGELGGYRWGTTRKRVLITRECLATQQAAALLPEQSLLWPS